MRKPRVPRRDPAAATDTRACTRADTREGAFCAQCRDTDQCVHVCACQACQGGRPAGTATFSLSLFSSTTCSHFVFPLPFPSQARGIATNQGLFLPADQETVDADILRMAVFDALCRSPARRKEFQTAVTSVELAEGGIGPYCQRLTEPAFWGGEVELIVLSRLLRLPIYVYKSVEETDPEAGEWGFAPFVKYGVAYEGGGKGSAASAPAGRKPVHLLYASGNHYDLLVR